MFSLVRNRVEPDPRIDEAIRSRESDVERLINYGRFGFGLFFSLTDGISIAMHIGAGMPLLYLWGALQLFGIAFCVFVHWMLHQKTYQSWLKYLTISHDVIGTYILFRIYEQHDLLSDAHGATVALCGASFSLVVMTGAIRMSRWAILYGTILGTILSTAIALEFARIEPTQVALMSATMTLSTGVISWLISANVSSLYLTLRRREDLMRFLPKQVVEEYDAGRIDLNLGGDRRSVTILFSDIRGFTTLCEERDARELTDQLIEYLTAMTNIIYRHRGTVDKYIGDAILAVFGAPVTHDDDADRALQVAVEMRTALRELNQHWKETGQPELRIGIGLHSGQVVAGKVGSPDRMEYTVIGDAVNVASRIEGLTKELGESLLFSDATRERLTNQEATLVSESPIRGREKTVKLFTRSDDTRLGGGEVSNGGQA